MLNWSKYPLLFVVLTCALTLALPAAAQSLRLDELISHHLDSIASPAARASVKSRGAQGPVLYSVLVGHKGQANGTAVLVSDGNQLAFLMRLPSTEYPGEHFVWDGKKTFIATIGAGVRSGLGNFVFHHDQILKSGLFGGVLSTAWPLYDVAAHKARIKYDGLKKVDGRELQEIAYSPAHANAPAEILLYFDPQTFQHVKTIYRLTLQPNMAPSPTETPFQRISHWQLQEDFSDFRRAGNFTLPMRWTIRFNVDGDRSLALLWDVSLERADANPPLNPRDLSVP